MQARDQELSAEAEAAIDKVEKLLAMARGNANEHESQNALDLAHQILERFNLDMAMVERKAGDSASPHAARGDKSTGGGLYKWQRAVWKQTAELNMCRYFSIKGLTKGQKYENRVVGSKANMVMTQVMAEYLQDTIERIAAEWARDMGYKSRFVQEAVIYREGMADRICERLRDLQRERIAEAKRQKAEQQAAANHPAVASTGTALTIVDVMGNEEDLNEDYLNGYELGTTARNRREGEARIAERERRRKLWKEDRTAFMIEFVDDTQAQADQQRYDAQDADWELYMAGKESKTYGKPSKPRASRAYSGYRRENAENRRKDHWANGEGRRAGENVSLSDQITHKTKKVLS